MSTRWLGGALLALAGAALLAIPLWPDTPESANRRLDERMDSLEKKLDKADERSRNNEANFVATEVQVDEMARTLDRIEPKNAEIIELHGGGGHKWVLRTGAEATVKFVALGPGDTVVFRIKHKTLDGEFALRAGESVRAVDDRGTELRVYTTTLHAVERDRTGAPRRARVSVSYAIESGI